MHRLTYIVASGVAAAMLSGCVIVDADVRESHWGAHGDFGYLYGAEVSGRDPEITIIARSADSDDDAHLFRTIDAHAFR